MSDHYRKAKANFEMRQLRRPVEVLPLSVRIVLWFAVLLFAAACTIFVVGLELLK